MEVLRRRPKKKNQELALESLQLRRLFRKTSLFHKIFESEHSEYKYVFNIIPVRSLQYTTINMNNIPLFNTKHNFFKNYFVPSAIIE